MNQKSGNWTETIGVFWKWVFTRVGPVHRQIQGGVRNRHVWKTRRNWPIMSSRIMVVEKASDFKCLPSDLKAEVCYQVGQMLSFRCCLESSWLGAGVWWACMGLGWTKGYCLVSHGDAEFVALVGWTYSILYRHLLLLLSPCDRNTCPVPVTDVG